MAWPACLEPCGVRLPKSRKIVYEDNYKTSLRCDRIVNKAQDE